MRSGPRSLLLLTLCIVSGPVVGETMSVPGPAGALEGEAILVPGATAGVLIVPGSGPTDRDGNGPAGLQSDTYKLLAEGLARDGIATLRIDKRGFFGSKDAIADPEDVTIGDYADDVRLWHDTLTHRIGADCVWIAGHSEGGLVALVAAARGLKPCGLILLATPGRPVGDLMREQIRKNPANGRYLPELDRIVSALERGELTDIDTISAELRPLFRPGLQRYMIDLFAYDPAKVAGSVTVPVLLLQGDRDLQVTVEDANRLSDALPQATVVIVPGMTHLLKQDVPGRPLATYTDPSLPLDDAVVPAISRFVGAAGTKPSARP